MKKMLLDIILCTGVFLKKNIEMTKLFIDYATRNNIILNINEPINENGNYPLLQSININNIEMTKLLLDYVTKNNIILKINEKDNNDNYSLLQCISQMVFYLAIKNNCKYDENTLKFMDGHLLIFLNN